MKPTHKIGIIFFPGISTMCLAVASVFEMANFHFGYPAYRVTLVSERGGPVATSVGNKILTLPWKRRVFDTILVAGEHMPRVSAPGLVKYLKSESKKTTRIGSVCTGAFVLAQAGLLDGRQATTHWNHARSFQKLYPKVKLEIDRIFTVDRRVWTSAGMSAGIDLALAMIEQDFDRDIARATAQFMVVYHRRAGGQSQYSALLDLDATSDRVQSALTYAKQNLDKRLSVEDLATAAFLSPRQFSRLFAEETGQSPAKAIERLRVESAKMMMESGRFSARGIAQKNGFGNRDRMRRSFLRAFGHPPQTIQRVVSASVR